MALLRIINAGITVKGAPHGKGISCLFPKTSRVKKFPNRSMIHSIHDDSHAAFNGAHSLKQIGNGDDSHDIPGFLSESEEIGYQINGTIPQMGSGLAVNQFAEMKRCFSVKDVSLFASLVGDSNPIHRTISQTNILNSFDFEDGEGHSSGFQGINFTNGRRNQSDDFDYRCSTTKLNKQTGGVFVHGMLVGSIFTAIIGTLIPGSVYLHQSFDFRRPVFTDSEVIGRIEVTKLRRFPRRGGLIMMCQTMVYEGDNYDSDQKDSANQQVALIRGQASVWIPNGVVQ